MYAQTDALPHSKWIIVNLRVKGILNHKSVCEYELTDVEFVSTFSFFPVIV